MDFRRRVGLKSEFLRLFAKVLTQRDSEKSRLWIFPKDKRYAFVLATKSYANKNNTEVNTIDTNIHDIFSSMVFNDSVMQERLPRGAYNALCKTMSDGSSLPLEIANIIANAMKDWAVEKGATHYTHWFQPMTGITAEKHEAFLSPVDGGRVIMEFSGAELVRGEPDASSFPHGGLRCIFEARGYTIWDTTSYAFIKDGSLCIPTAFAAYSGDALDKKTPLLRSMQALDSQALRILRLFGDATTQRVITTVGPEQEYFLIDRKLYQQRPDLIYAGRTLFGARPPKGQELSAHYYGSLHARVSSFMKELEVELWRLGVCVKTKHKEAAPAQYELAMVFGTANIATDHNQLTMELLNTIAARHGLVCLLHEKPFAGVNGSGKHNNWALATNTGQNLLDPDKTPIEQFLLFLVAVIKAVDDYQELLRVATASAGNDHRLGGYEAPPAIISIFLGDEWSRALSTIAVGGKAGAKLLEGDEEEARRAEEHLEIGVSSLPNIPKDTTDRNRTSPFAFTGNKFEFRMPGSSFSVADANVVLNTAVAQTLKEFADELQTQPNFKKTLHSLIKRTCKNHIRIIHNGNSYSQEWIEEAARRGLANHTDSVSAFPALISSKSIKLFTDHCVFSEAELASRYEMLADDYCKTIHIEGLTMQEISQSSIIPAIVEYQKSILSLVVSKLEASKYGAAYNSELESGLISQISGLGAALKSNLAALAQSLESALQHPEGIARAQAYRDTVLPAMHNLRTSADELEGLVAKKYWPLPSYAQMFYSLE